MIRQRRTVGDYCRLFLSFGRYRRHRRAENVYIEKHGYWDFMHILFCEMWRP